MATVDAQVLGHNATDYIMTSTPEQVATAALSGQESGDHRHQQFFRHQRYGLYANHAYAIVGYNASTDTFTLYNPWGTDQPGQLTWAQLQASCTQMAVCDTSGSAPIAGATAPTVSAKATLFGQVPDIAASVSPSTTAGAVLAQADLAVAAPGELSAATAVPRQTVCV